MWSDNDDDIYFGAVYVFDDERYLFEYNPNSPRYRDPKVPAVPSYSNLVLLMERTSELLGAWKKRSRSDLQDETDADHPNPYYLNLYLEDRAKFRSYAVRKFSEQLLFALQDETDAGHPNPNLLAREFSELLLGDVLDETDAEHPNPYCLHLYRKDRAKFRSYSVRKFSELLGGEEEVEKFSEKVKHAVAFVKRVLNVIISKCLPIELPYPAMNKILSQLMRDEGLQNVGFLSSEDEDDSEEEEEEGKFTETEVVNHLYYSLAVFYRYMKIIMFNSEPGTVLAAEDMRGSKQLFENNFDDLRAVLGPKLGTGKIAECIV